MTTSWNYFNPVNILINRGIFEKLSLHLKAGKWLLITTRGARKRGTIATIQAQLTSAHCLLVCDEITANPDLNYLDDLALRYRNQTIQGIIALGGGSVIDAAKILAVTLPSNLARPLHESLRIKARQDWKSRLPVIAIPTTAGTGSEVTPFATVWDKETHKKYSVSGSQIYPSLALLDPHLTLSLSKEQTLYTGLDATSHALESIWNKNSTPISTLLAWRALEIISDVFPVVLKDLGNINARESMQQASLFSGLAISQTRTAIAHSISYPLTSHYNIPHGLACSFTLPYLIKENIDFFHTTHQPIAQKILDILNSLNLKNELQKFSTLDFYDLFDEMFSIERAENYTQIADIKTIINQSIN